jgi:hypothetical protein
VAVPVPTSPRLAPELSGSPERLNLARSWQLRGIIRCSCGSSMAAHSSTRLRVSDKLTYHYYRCNRTTSYMPHSCGQLMARAEDVEEAVWAFVSEMLCDPDRVRAGVWHLAEQERAVRGAQLDPDKEARLWAEKVYGVRAEEVRVPGPAGGRFDNAGGALGEAGRPQGDTPSRRERVSPAAGPEERAKEIEEDGEALVRALSAAAPEAIRLLPPEDRLGLYGRLDIEVRNSPGGYRVSGEFCAPEPLSF